MGFLGDLGGLVVADLRIQGGDEHEGVLKVFADIGLDGFDAAGATVVKADAAIADQAGAVQEIIDHYGFEDVEFEVAGGAADIDGYVIAQDLCYDHGQGLALGRVHLARHDGGARFVVGDEYFADAAAGTGREHADIVGDLHEADGYGLQSAMGFNDGVMGGQGFEFIFRCHEGQTGEGGDLLRYILRIAGRSIDAGAYGRSAQGQFGQVGKGIFDCPQAVVQLRDITTEFLSQGEGGGIHKMSAPDLNDLTELLAFCGQGVTQLLDAGDGGLHQHFIGRDVHGRREGIVGRLRFVDVVVGVQGLFLVRQLAASEHMSPVSDYFIYIHITLGAAACLPDDEGEPGVQFAIQYFVTDLADEVRFFFGENAGFQVGEGRCFLQVGKGADDLFRHPVDVLCDLEVLYAALGLCSVIGVDRYFDFAHRIFFYPVFHSYYFARHCLAFGPQS